MSTSVGPRDDAFAPVTIVVLVDGSALSELSVPLTQQLSLRFDAEVRTVTVGGDGHKVAAGLLSLADQVTPPALVAIDSHHAGEHVRHDVAYQLIRESRWPILATLGT